MSHLEDLKAQIELVMSAISNVKPAFEARVTQDKAELDAAVTAAVQVAVEHYETEIAALVEKFKTAEADLKAATESHAAPVAEPSPAPAQ